MTKKALDNYGLRINKRDVHAVAAEIRRGVADGRIGRYAMRSQVKWNTTSGQVWQTTDTPSSWTESIDGSTLSFFTVEAVSGQTIINRFYDMLCNINKYSWNHKGETR